MSPVSNEPVYIRVARLSELAEKRGTRVIVGDEEIALWRVDGVVYAISNVCAHQHIPALYQGILEGLTVACPMHGWTYSLATGKAESGNGSVKTYRVKVDQDVVYVEQPTPLW